MAFCSMSFLNHIKMYITYKFTDIENLPAMNKLAVNTTREQFFP